MLFGGVYQHGQLTKLVLSNPYSFDEEKYIVTAKELHQWFLMSSKCVSFQLELRGYNKLAKSDMMEVLLRGYKTVFDALCRWQRFGLLDIIIYYPKERISHDISSGNDQVETPVRYCFLSEKYQSIHLLEVSFFFITRREIIGSI